MARRGEGIIHFLARRSWERGFRGLPFMRPFEEAHPEDREIYLESARETLYDVRQYDREQRQGRR